MFAQEMPIPQSLCLPLSSPLAPQPAPGPAERGPTSPGFLLQDEFRGRLLFFQIVSPAIDLPD
jgi:hypothetical protein